MRAYAVPTLLLVAATSAWSAQAQGEQAGQYPANTPQDSTATTTTGTGNTAPASYQTGNTGESIPKPFADNPDIKKAIERNRMAMRSMDTSILTTAENAAFSNNMQTMTNALVNYMSMSATGSGLVDNYRRWMVQNQADLEVRFGRVTGRPGMRTYGIANTGLGLTVTAGLIQDNSWTDSDAPLYAPVGVMKDLAEGFNKDINQKIDRARTKMNNLFNKNGCNSFDWGSEFVALFNVEALKNLLKNLSSGIVAAAPMALLQALDPELANILQHLKAMAGVALQISQGNCTAIQGALTNASTRVFQGPGYMKCLDNAKASGLSQEAAYRTCSAEKGDGALIPVASGFKAIGMDGGLGSSINNTSDRISLWAGSDASWEQAGQTVETRNGQAASAYTSSQSAKTDRATAINSMKTSLASSGDNVTNMTEEQIVARYKAKNPQSYAMGGPDASYEAAQATIKSSQVKMADSGLSISDWAGKYNQNMTSTSASDNGSSILSKGDKIWGEVKDSVWGQMAKDLSGMVRVDFTEPVASVQVGNRNMSFTLMRLRHQAIELGWEFNDCLISAWSYYLACDFQNMETRLAAAESYMAPFNSDEWRKTAAAWDFGQGIMMPGDDTKRDRYDRMLGMKIRRPHLMSMARAAWMAKVGSAADQSVALKHFISGDNFFFRQGDPDITKAQIEDLKEFGNMGIEQYTMQLMEANLAAFIMKEVSSPEYESYVKELIGQSLKYQGQNASIVQAEIKGKISQAFTAPATSLVKFSMVLPLTPMSIPSSECVTPTRVNVGDGASPRQYRRVSVGVF